MEGHSVHASELIVCMAECGTQELAMNKAVTVQGWRLVVGRNQSHAIGVQVQLVMLACTQQVSDLYPGSQLATW